MARRDSTLLFFVICVENGRLTIAYKFVWQTYSLCVCVSNIIQQALALKILCQYLVTLVHCYATELLVIHMVQYQKSHQVGEAPRI